jgi:prepilin peptidase CpaA
MSIILPLLLAVFPALVIVAALKDATSFTIPNWISIALALAFAPAALAGGLSLEGFGLHLAVGFAALVAGIAMFALRWIGGGDAKLFAAASLWLGLAPMPQFLIVTALAGGGLALALVNLRSNWARSLIPAGPAWVERLREPKGDAPYGVAIAAGALVAFPQAAAALMGAG